ncbi:MAG: F0F1 ATP synthase subunit delta [Candidatus Paceibacterota bacterium]
MAKLTHNPIVDIVYNALKDKSGDDLKEAIAQVLGVLQKKKFRAHMGFDTDDSMHALVRTATPLSESSKKAIQNFLEQKYQVDRLVLVESVDPTLKGGLIIKIKDEVIDLSVDGQIKNLHNYLVKHI